MGDFNTSIHIKSYHQLNSASRNPLDGPLVYDVTVKDIANLSPPLKTHYEISVGYLKLVSINGKEAYPPLFRVSKKDWAALAERAETAKSKTEKELRLSVAIAEKIALQGAMYLTTPSQDFDFNVSVNEEKIHVQGTASLFDAPFEQFPNHHYVKLEFENGHERVRYEGFVEVKMQKPS